MFENVLKYDTEWLIFINQWGSEGQDVFWLYITETTTWLPFFALLLFLNFKWFPKKTALLNLAFIALTVGTTLLMTQLAKEWVMRFRPINDPEIQQHLRILIQSHQYSFFSGHASNSFSATTIIYLIFKHKSKWVSSIFVWPVFYSFSRLYLGVHFPTDVFIGALSGIAIAFFYFRWYKLKLIKLTP